jgi:hypothetical protein
VVVVVLLGVFAMGAHFAATGEQHTAYPTTDDLATDYEAYVGDTVFLFGTVRSVDEATDSARLVFLSSSGPVAVTASNFEADVEPGGSVQLLGTARPGKTIEIRRTAVVNPAGSSKLFKYGISAGGALLVLVAFFRHWSVELRTLSIHRRA